MAAHQASQSLGFSRQEHWSGLPFPSPMHESEKWKWSCSVVSDSSRPHGLQPTRLLRPWDFLGKSTGVGCHWPIILLYVKYFQLVFITYRSVFHRIFCRNNRYHNGCFTEKFRTQISMKNADTVSHAHGYPREGWSFQPFPHICDHRYLYSC